MFNDVIFIDFFLFSLEQKSGKQVLFCHLEWTLAKEIKYRHTSWNKMLDIFCFN